MGLILLIVLGRTADGRPAELALQPELGLRPQRRPGPAGGDRPGPAARGSYVRGF